MKIINTFLVLFLIVFAHAYTPPYLPSMEDPLLMTVWGSSVELDTVNYLCAEIHMARDYSPGVTFDKLLQGAGFGKGGGNNGEYFYDFYEPGTQYKSLIVIAGEALDSSAEDIERIERLASHIKNENGTVMIIDIDIENSGNKLTKSDFASRILPFIDVLILAESSIENYSLALKESAPLIVELPTVVDLLTLFERDFGGGRCCD